MIQINKHDYPFWNHINDDYYVSVQENKRLNRMDPDENFKYSLKLLTNHNSRSYHIWSEILRLKAEIFVFKSPSRDYGTNSVHLDAPLTWFGWANCILPPILF